jgi:hypothetical protein
MKDNLYYTKRDMDVFNSPIEMGLRALIILNEVKPRALDLNRIVIYDYLLTHSGDVDDSMKSLHPAIPHRSGEIVVKRKVMQDGLNLMRSRELIDIEYSSNGIFYKANSLSNYFISYLDTNYAKSLLKYSKWLNERFGNYSDVKITDFINVNISKWGSEFSMESLVRGVFNE